LETSERNEVKIENDPSKEIISFVENIEFSDSIIPKNEIKEKKGFDQEVWKSSPFDVKQKLDQVEAYDSSKETISFVENIEFSENIIPKQEIKEDKGFNTVHEKKTTDNFTVKAGENNPKKTSCKKSTVAGRLP
jgi:hypothetical protein